MLVSVRRANFLLSTLTTCFCLFSNHAAFASSLMPILPDSAGTAGLTSWGGNDQTRWKPESVLANAVSLALNRAWQSPDISDAIVAVPLTMVSSNFHSSGDGQTNANLNFGSWMEPRPPLVGVLERMKFGTSQVTFFFDQSLPITGNQVQISYRVQGKRKTLSLNLQSEGGIRSASWTVDSALDWGLSTQTNVVFVQPKGWTDWFPIYFRHPVVAASDLLHDLRPEDQILAGGRSALDPEKVSAQIPGNSQNVKDTLIAHVGHFGAGFNQEPFQSTNDHAEFPVGSSFVPTGVGQGWTWVLQPPISFIKNMYLCFQGRDEASEAANGVPSGAGPHQIGIDPNPNNPGNYAGTIINSLENSPMPFATAVKSPSAEGPPSGNYAYGLRDVATVRWMKPGEGVVVTVAQSDWGYAEGKPASVTANYHWFYFNQDTEFCAQGWVSPCMPHANNGIGLNPTPGCEKPSP